MDSQLLILANQIVEKIDRKIRRENKKSFFEFKKTIDIGADGTPTKFIDKMAEEIAIKTIKKSKIKVNLLSEEAGFLDFNGEYVFVLDPIDGTRNACRGIPFFSVSLAIGKSKLNDVEYGIVKNIPTGDIYIAEKNKGAYLNNKQIFACEVPPKELLSSIVLGNSCGPRSNFLSRENKVRSLGAASLEMCLVASGGLDYYFVENEYMRIIDIAASTLILREAGGFVKDTKGKELEMDFNIHKRTNLIAACSKYLIDDILNMQKK